MVTRLDAGRDAKVLSYNHSGCHHVPGRRGFKFGEACSLSNLEGRYLKRLQAYEYKRPVSSLESFDMRRSMTGGSQSGKRQ